MHFQSNYWKVNAFVFVMALYFLQGCNNRIVKKTTCLYLIENEDLKTFEHIAILPEGSFQSAQILKKSPKLIGRTELKGRYSIKKDSISFTIDSICHIYKYVGNFSSKNNRNERSERIQSWEKSKKATMKKRVNGIVFLPNTYSRDYHISRSKFLKELKKELRVVRRKAAPGVFVSVSKDEVSALKNRFDLITKYEFKKDSVLRFYHEGLLNYIQLNEQCWIR